VRRVVDSTAAIRRPPSHTRPVTLPLEPSTVPPPFATAVRGLRAALNEHGRAGLVLQEVPAPKRMAPHAMAVAGEVERDNEQIASGRFVALHDPQGQQGWHGDTRVVAFVQADVEREMGADPALAGAGWSWLTESLADRGAHYTAAGGTVTRTVSVRFGQISDAPEVSELEIRASWTPRPDADDRLDLGVHLLAWCDVLCSTAGLPPPGVLALPSR